MLGDLMSSVSPIGGKGFGNNQKNHKNSGNK
jgi:hypothetical protein